MFTVRLAAFLPALLLCSATASGVDAVTVTPGDTVSLPCTALFENNDTAEFVVEWKKDRDSLCKNKIRKNNTLIYYCNRQFSINPETFGLIITGVDSSNAGLYNCTLTKLIPPPSEDTFSLLQVNVSPGLSLQQLNSSDVTCVELLCTLDGLRPEQVNFTWTKADEKLPHYHNTIMSSTLKLCKPDWWDGVTLTCQVSYSHNFTVYKKNITLTCRNTGGCKDYRVVVISASSACLGLLLILLLSVAVYKSKKRKETNENIFFNNKIYENFNFFSARPNAEPHNDSSVRTAGRPNLRRGPLTGEECIYEN